MKPQRAPNIPIGHYCYTWEELPDAPDFHGKINLCPHWQVKNINGVDLPWCALLDAGSLPGSFKNWRSWEDPDVAIEKLKDHFKDEYEEKTALFLLWDQVKECGENYG